MHGADHQGLDSLHMCCMSVTRRSPSLWGSLLNNPPWMEGASGVEIKLKLEGWKSLAVLYKKSRLKLCSLDTALLAFLTLQSSAFLCLLADCCIYLLLIAKCGSVGKCQTIGGNMCSIKSKTNRDLLKYKCQDDTSIPRQPLGWWFSPLKIVITSKFIVLKWNKALTHTHTHTLAWNRKNSTFWQWSDHVCSQSPSSLSCKDM